MLAIFFTIAGLYMIFKKEVKISSKKSIKGKVAQKIGLIFIIPAILSYILKLIPENPINVFLIYVIFTGYAVAIISIFILSFSIKLRVKTKLKLHNGQN